MLKKPVEFYFLTGLKSPLFSNARLGGSWDSEGRYSDQWTETPMQPVVCEDGCPGFRADLRAGPVRHSHPRRSRDE